MNPILQRALSLYILHDLVTVVSVALIVVLFAYMIVSWIPQWREGKIGRFVADLASPIIGPLDRMIPPINLGGLRFSIGFFVGWWAIGVVAALILQALPAGW
jgi:YggT family protein